MKRTFTVIVLIVVVMTASGCWSRKELSDYALVSGVFIDKSNGMYNVSLQVVDPKQISSGTGGGGGGGGGKSPIVVYTQKGRSIQEAIRRISNTSPREIYLGHLRALLISERTAREGIKDTLDYFRRSARVRNDFAIFVARRTHKPDALMMMSNLEKVSATEFFRTLEASEKIYPAWKFVRMDELVSTLVSSGRSAVLTGLEVTGDLEEVKNADQMNQSVDPVKSNLSGLGVFKRDHLIGWLNEKEGLVLNLLTKNIKVAGFVMDCPTGKGKVTYTAAPSKIKIKGSLKEDVPYIDIFIRADMNIGELNCRVDLEDPAILFEFQSSSVYFMEEAIMQVIAEVKKKYGTDVFGFGELIHRSDPKGWQKVRANWDEHFVQSQVKVKVDAFIRELGEVGSPLSEGERKEGKD